MSRDGPSSASTPSTSAWHSIRPWNPLLSLSVREITSVSATFILSSSLADTDDEHNEHEDASARPSIISDALAKGLSVTVNGSPWQRVFIRIDDKLDEAVIIIYGLMPGRQYDINLALFQAGQTNNIHRQVITEDDDADPSELNTDLDSVTFDAEPAASTPSTSPTQTTFASTPPSSSSSSDLPQLTLEDRLAQHQHTLSLVHTERDALTASLKSARRDSQKADAALRTEIDILKRASEKHAAVEHRARQKILALQEAARRAQAATRETEAQAVALEDALPGLHEQKEAKEAAHAQLTQGADRAQREREQVQEKEKKRLEALRGELAGLTNRLERLQGRRERLEGTALPELEEQVREVERELERETQRAAVFDMDDLAPQNPPEEHQPTYMPMPMPRRQQSGPGPGPIGRPSPPAPIQRPTPSDSPTSFLHHHDSPVSILSHESVLASFSHTHSHSHPSWTPPPRHTQTHNQHNPRTNSTSASASLSLSPSPTPAHVSTLSSRAPAFEPGRGIKGLSGGGAAGAGTTSPPSGTSSGFSVSPTPIQRPVKSGQGWAGIYDQR